MKHDLTVGNNIKCCDPEIIPVVDSTQTPQLEMIEKTFVPIRRYVYLLI